jgi:hypothetical protein
MQRGPGITLQISEIPANIVLDQFLLETKIKCVGNLDTYFTNEEYNYVTVLDTVARPWSQTNPVKPIGYAEGYLKIEDMILIYPMDPEAQSKIQLMPKAERAIFYMGPFVVQGNLIMGADMQLAEAMDSLVKRFLILTEASLYPMFPATAAMPEVMPVVLLNRAKISQYHAAEG